VALAPFQEGVHHIGLGDVDDTGDLPGFLIAGGYTKGFRRIFQSDFNGIRYGQGEALVNVPGLSSWSQDDFSGGAYQYVWGKDPAMFAGSKNFLPYQFGRTVRSVPPLVEWLGGKRNASVEVPMLITAYNGYLYALFQASVKRWDLSTGVSSSQALSSAGGQHRACFLRDQGVIFHAKDDVVSAVPLDLWSGNLYVFGKPPSAVGNITGLDANGGRLAIAYQDVLWTALLKDDRTVAPDPNPPSKDFTRIGRLPGRWAASAYTSGLLYILLSGPDTPTQLVAFDGTSILPITEFPYNFVGESMIVYGGRIYVGGSGRDIQTAAPRYAELYEITGASLRLVRTFAPERYGAGGTFAKSIPTMAVHEGLLFLSIEGVGLVTYDLTTDSFAGASTYQPADANAIVQRLTSGRDSLFAWVYPFSGVPSTGAWFRPATGQESITNYYSELETSDFAASFDRLKAWKQLRVLLRNPTSAALLVQYSVDGGVNYTSAPTGVASTAGNYSLVTFDISGAPDSRMIRFRIQVPNQVDVTEFRELVGYTATFRMLDSDVVGTGEREKRSWVFTVGGFDRMEAADGTTVVQDLSTMRSQLWEWSLERKKLNFRDIDGELVVVEIDDVKENQPVILPEVAQSDNLTRGSSREAYFNLTLVEV